MPWWPRVIAFGIQILYMYIQIIPNSRCVRNLLRNCDINFEPDRVNENKTTIFDNEQTTSYVSRIGGVKNHTKAQISLCTSVVHAYDQEGPFIQGNCKYSPKQWLYNNISKDNIRKLREPDEVNRQILDQNRDKFWNQILKEEYDKCFLINGHIEDDISEIVYETNHKKCACGNNEKNSKRICSKCKEVLPTNPAKKFRADHPNVESRQSPVDRRRDIYKNITRGPDFEPADLVTGKPLDRNPSKYEDTKEIIREISAKSGIKKYGLGEREWMAICCDGSPFKNFLSLFPFLTFCNSCKIPAGDLSIHCEEYHNGVKDDSLFDLEFDHILPLNGPGHTEKLIMEATTKLLWSVIGLKSFATWCDFKSDKAKAFLMNFSDHHKGWDFLYIVLMSIAKEIAFEFVKCWKITKNKIPKYENLIKWLTKSNEVSNVHLVRFFHLMNGPLLSMFFLRCGVRCANPQLYYAAYEKASLTLFLNKNFNYQIISTFELYLIKQAPVEVRKYIYRTIIHRIKKHESWDCSSEGLDYRIEEENRKFKQNLYTEDPAMIDWINAMASTKQIEEMKENARKDYNIIEDICEPYSPDYDSKIQYCRSMLRELEYLDYDTKTKLKNLDGVKLHKDTLQFEEKATEMKNEYIDNVIESESFVNAAPPEFNFKKFPKTK